MSEPPICYWCPCGFTFLVELGEYGCPNCNGTSGEAEIDVAPNIPFATEGCVDVE